MVKTKNMCHQDFDLIKSWSWNDTIEHSALALPQGWNDLEKLASSYKAMYPTILGDNYSPFNYTFSHSNTDRTRASCKAFISGLFGTYKSVPMLSKNIMLRVCLESRRTEYIYNINTNVYVCFLKNLIALFKMQEIC